MKPSNFLLISLLILLPSELLQNCGPEAVSCDYTSGCSNRKKEYENETKLYYKDHYSDSTNRKSKAPAPVKLSCDHTPNEKLRDERRVNKKQEETCRQEVQSVKKSAKSQAKRRDPHYESKERRKHAELSKDDNTRMPTKKRNVMCAECEQCELQVKAGGEGVMLKCSGCRIVAPDEVMFPSGKSKRIVKLP